MEGDHIEAWSKGGRTTISNCQALCGPCNREKGNRAGFAREIRSKLEVWPSDGNLRTWQQTALELVAGQAEPLLIEACPGAGKTRFAQELAYHLYATGEINRILVAVPTSRLVKQWVDSCNQFNDGSPKLPMSPAGWTPVRPIYDTELGAVFTYQALFANPIAFEALAGEAGYRTLVLLDEVHHVGNSAGWGVAAQSAFFGSAQRLVGLSGTAFRTHDRISFVQYNDDGRAIADFSYGYGRAVTEGVCRPLEFRLLGGVTEFETAPEHSEVVDFEDDLNERGRSYRLRTALDLHHSDGGWMRNAVIEADRVLSELRNSDTDAGGLVVAMDIAHANQIAELLTTITGTRPAIAVSKTQNPDDPSPSIAIDQFDSGSQRWIVAVKMISEGVDIRRLRVLLYATNITAELAFRQIVGRVVRSDNANSPDFGVVVLPADPALRELAERVASELPAGTAALVEVDASPPTPPDIRRPDPSGHFRPVSSSGEYSDSWISQSGTDRRLSYAMNRYLAEERSGLTLVELEQICEADPAVRQQLLDKYSIPE